MQYVYNTCSLHKLRSFFIKIVEEFKLSSFASLFFINFPYLFLMSSFLSNQGNQIISTSCISMYIVKIQIPKLQMLIFFFINNPFRLSLSQRLLHLRSSINIQRLINTRYTISFPRVFNITI